MNAIIHLPVSILCRRRIASSRRCKTTAMMMILLKKKFSGVVRAGEVPEVRSPEVVSRILIPDSGFFYSLLTTTLILAVTSRCSLIGTSNSPVSLIGSFSCIRLRSIS